mmetsp:Transcript_10780/g.18210  ORF Transcript_10780/g.18210 Transcript_10780/m.18210 type:complete len:315 (-) Transcript_10780:213-1157(-)
MLHFSAESEPSTLPAPLQWQGVEHQSGPLGTTPKAEFVAREPSSLIPGSAPAQQQDHMSIQSTHPGSLHSIMSQSTTISANLLASAAGPVGENPSSLMVTSPDDLITTQKHPQHQHQQHQHQSMHAMTPVVEDDASMDPLSELAAATCTGLSEQPRITAVAPSTGAGVSIEAGSAPIMSNRTSADSWSAFLENILDAPSAEALSAHASIINHNDSGIGIHQSMMHPPQASGNNKNENLLHGAAAWPSFELQQKETTAQDDADFFSGFQLLSWRNDIAGGAGHLSSSFSGQKFLLGGETQDSEEMEESDIRLKSL